MARLGLLEHWQLKVLALAFAVLLWLFVVSQERTEAVFMVPLDLTERPAALEVASVGVEAVVVRVEGPRSVLARIREDELRAEVSLRDARPGRFLARIEPANVRAPRGVRVVRVTPSQIRATLQATGRPAPLHASLKAARARTRGLGARRRQPSRVAGASA